MADDFACRGAGTRNDEESFDEMGQIHLTEDSTKGGIECEV